MEEVEALIKEFECKMSAVPDEGKSGNISDIQKRGRTDPGNYRPVSLTSIICKVQEKTSGGTYKTICKEII